MVAVRVAFKDLDWPSRRLRCGVLLGSLPLVTHAGIVADLTLSHVPTQGHPDVVWPRGHWEGRVIPVALLRMGSESFGLFVPKSLDRVERGGLPGWVDAEDKADDAGDGERGHGPDGGHLCRQHGAEGELEHQGEEGADEDADHPAEGAEGYGFESELQHEGAPGRAQSRADAYLPRSLRDRDQHDVHDADAAHHEADARDPDEKDEEAAG